MQDQSNTLTTQQLQRKRETWEKIKLHLPEFAEFLIELEEKPPWVSMEVHGETKNNNTKCSTP